MDNLTEIVTDSGEFICSKGLILPFRWEKDWPYWFRVVVYCVGLLYLFLGIAKIADIFMVSIEKITSQTRKIKYTTENNEEKYITRSVWNPTIANLTLMALGSSCPEILLSIIEIAANKFQSGALGPGTIVGTLKLIKLKIC